MNSSAFLYLFVAFLLVNLLGIQLQNEVMQVYSKPFIIPSLIFYFHLSTRNISSKLKRWIVGALFFSWIGDVLLIFHERDSLFFLLGLSAFLIAHIFYILFFHNVKAKENIQSRWWLLVPVVVYYGVLIKVLYPYLADMKVPVPVYGIVISFMLLLALHMIFLKQKSAGFRMMIGAILFIASDSVLAFNKFYEPFESAGTIIMLTYGLAQLMITAGAIQYLRSELKS